MTTDKTKDAALDAALDMFDMPEPSEGLRGKILADLPQKGAANDNRFVFRRIAAALIAVFAIGFAAMNLPLLTTGEPSADTAIWQQAANTLGVEDIYLWVEGEEGASPSKAN